MITDANGRLHTIGTQQGTWDVGTVTTVTTVTNDVNIADGGNIISVDDGAGSLTVDGSVTVSATNLDIRDLTHVSDSVKVGDGTETANVNASNELQVRDDDANTDLDTIAGDTTSIDGKITACNTGAVVISSGTVTTITNDVSIDDGGNSITVDDGATTLSIDDGAGSLTIDNAALSVTGGGTEASAMRVTLANNSTGLLSVDDNASSLTVDTTGTSGLEVIQDTAADQNVTEASAAASLTALQIMDDWDDNDAANTFPQPRAEQYDDAGGGVAYHGWAAVGTATSTGSWRIRRITTTGSDVAIDWADGNANYDNVWDNRAALSYS